MEVAAGCKWAAPTDYLAFARWSWRIWPMQSPVENLLESRTANRIDYTNLRIYVVSNMIKIDLVRMEESASDASQLLTAMANPKRLLILCNLLDQELNVGQLAERVDLGQSPLSQHLSKLRAWGLVRARRDAQQVNYSLASDKVRQVLTTLYDIYCAC